jgi:hypothetical protein
MSSLSPLDEIPGDVCVRDCLRVLFEAVGEGSFEKLRWVISVNSKMDFLNMLLLCNANGETPLEFAIKNIANSGSCAEVLVYFLQQWHPSRRLDLGDVEDSPEVDALDYCTLSSQVIDALSNRIPILMVLEHLITEYSSIAWLEFLATTFTNSNNFTREDKIIALELIGAHLLIDDIAFLYRPYRNPGSKDGLQLWRQAMSLRLLPANGEPLLPKIPHVEVPTEASVAVFGSFVEVTTMEELDLLQEEIERHFHWLHDDGQEWRTLSTAMRGQVLLLVRRISKQNYADGPYALYLRHLQRCPPIHVLWALSSSDYGQAAKLVMNTCLLILEQAIGNEHVSISKNSFKMFSRSLRYMCTLLTRLLRKPPGTPGRELLSCANLLVPPQFFIAILNYFKAPHMMSREVWDGFDNFGHLVSRFLYLVDSMASHLTERENQQLEDCYSNIICSYFSDRSATVIHAAILSAKDYGFDTDAVLKLVRFALKLGADPNIIDRHGKTPLHRLAADYLRLPEHVSLFETLVDDGGHLDIATFNGDTVLAILHQSLQYVQANSQILGYSLPGYYASLLKEVFPLSCLCARVIREHGIPFDGGRLPLRLQEFVARHRPTEGDGLLKNSFNRFTYRVCNFLMVFFLNFLHSLRRR